MSRVDAEWSLQIESCFRRGCAGRLSGRRFAYRNSQSSAHVRDHQAAVDVELNGLIVNETNDASEGWRSNTGQFSLDKLRSKDRLFSVIDYQCRQGGSGMNKIALVALGCLALGACATPTQTRGTAGGVVAGAAIGGPVGAVVGGAVGAVATRPALCSAVLAIAAATTTDMATFTTIPVIRDTRAPSTRLLPSGVSPRERCRCGAICGGGRVVTEASRSTLSEHVRWG